MVRNEPHAPYGSVQCDSSEIYRSMPHAHTDVLYRTISTFDILLACCRERSNSAYAYATASLDAPKLLEIELPQHAVRGVT